jgi:glutathionylspermidine synthase
MTPSEATAAADYTGFARRLTASGLVTDPWVDGTPRFQTTPLPLARADHDAMARAAEAVAGVLDELGGIVSREPALLDDFFAMTPAQKLMWQASAPLWHGIARADVFLRDEQAPVVCELNCDTPSGLAEAVCLGRLAAAEGVADVNAGLGARFLAVLSRFVDRLSRCRPAANVPNVPMSVGIIYPTEMTDDLGLITLYRDWCEQAGHTVVLGSPYNLQRVPGGVAMFGRRVDVVLRHYKTDWWGERLPLRDDEQPFADPEPLTEPLAALLRAELAGEVAVVNPFGAVLPQNKRAFAFCWERLERFSPEAQAVIRATIPYSLRLESADRDLLLRERDGWVLKTDYGCEGEEVVLGRDVSQEVWADLLAHAIPRRWVAQRRFDARRDAAGRVANHGVFVAAGCAAGLYTRLSVGATDASAISVAPVVET